jgi:DNA topoisomerase I
MIFTISSSGTVTLDAPLKAAVPVADYALSASLSSEVDGIVSELERTGKLPVNLPVALRDKMAASLKRYFGKISADKIQQFTDKASQIVQDTLRTTEEDRGAGVRPAEVGLNPATSRSALTGFLEEATGGAIGDFMGVGFFLRIAREVVQGGTQYVAQNWDAVRVDEFPALEFHRVYDREVPRGSEKDPAGPENAWDDDDGRWVAAAEESGDDDAAEVFEDTGRMVALKSSGIWESLGNGAGDYTDTLGNPFPPFAFNSGFDTDEVSRKEAVALGLMDDVDGDGKKVTAKPANVDFGTLFDLPDDLEARCAKWQVALQAEEAGHEFHGNQWTQGGGISLKRIGEGKEAKWVTGKGEPIPEHAAKLTIPPAWKNVQVAPSPEHDLQAIGEDAKGRVQRIYSDAFTQRSADAKFSRTSELIKKQDKIFAQNEDNLKSEDPKIRENAAAMKLIQQTGIRPGSDTDTGAEKQAYGATTLEGRHVVSDNDGNVRLQFVGKKGVSLDIPVEDKDTAKMMLDRKESAGLHGKIFDTNDASLRDYSHTLNGGSFKPKDFRTLKGTTTAMEEVSKTPAPKTFADYKKAVMNVAKKVATKLGNTPTIALQSYISPSVFSAWKAGLA